MKPCPTRGHLLGACGMAGRPMAGSGMHMRIQGGNIPPPGAVLPSGAAERSCQAGLPSGAAEQCCRAVLPISAAEQCCRSVLPSSAAEQCCRAVLSSGVAAQKYACTARDTSPLRRCVGMNTFLEKQIRSHEWQWTRVASRIAPLSGMGQCPVCKRLQNNGECVSPMKKGQEWQLACCLLSVVPDSRISS